MRFSSLKMCVAEEIQPFHMFKSYLRNTKNRYEKGCDCAQYIVSYTVQYNAQLKGTTMERSIFAQDIHPLSEFRSNASGFISQVQKTKRPLIITQNGKSAAVVLDVNEYDKLLEKIELIKDIETALNQIGGNEGVSHSKALQQLQSRYSK